MSTSGKELTTLGTRAVFNRTLRHIVNVSNLIDQVERGANLADLLNKLVADGIITNDQVAPILSVILVSRLNLPYRSTNIEKTVTDFSAVTAAMTKWNAVDLVVAYHHPNLGTMLVNPRKESDWAAVHELKRHELVVAYGRVKGNNPDTAAQAVEGFFALLNGKTPTENPGFIDLTRREEPKPAPQPVQAAAPAPTSAPAPSGPVAAAPPPSTPGPTGKNLTPKYSVQVSNELFHNGNVEAWKNIIEAFVASHPDCKVIVYHEGELIQDLNSLFKWGKVKHGGLIMFQVAGGKIKNVSRLQKYLFEGASKRYEAFMKHDVNKVLNLF